MNEKVLTVICPIYNEIGFITKLLDCFLEADVDPTTTEFLLIDGMSTDGTREVLEHYCSKHPHFKLLDNPQKYQVNALNIGISNALGEFIIRCDAHAEYPPTYFSFLLGKLNRFELANVAGMAVATPPDSTTTSRVISYLLSSGIASGPGHRDSKIQSEIEVDTVLFGAWKKTVFESVGLFDELFIRGQDYEHNVRVLKNNGRVILFPELRFKYFTRNSLRKFARMMFQYAYAKAYILKCHGFCVGVRSFVPLCFFVSLLLTALMNFWLTSFILFLYVLLAVRVAVGYFLKYKDPKGFFLIPIFMLSQHISHAAGLMKGIIASFVLRKPQFLEHTR